MHKREGRRNAKVGPENAQEGWGTEKFTKKDVAEKCTILLQKPTQTDRQTHTHTKNMFL